MTCNKDCKNCMYGKAKPTRFICSRPESTCNGSCNQCQFALITRYEVWCNYGKSDYKS